MQQHNHHCLITFMGHNWWIASAMPGRLELARRIDADTIMYCYCYTHLVDWKSYCRAAVEFDYANQ
jgi:hypothetical protein